MLVRRTFIVRVDVAAHIPTVEDVSTGERVRLPDVASVAQEIERRLVGEASESAREDRGDDRAMP